MEFHDLQQLVESNAKAIAALTNHFNEQQKEAAIERAELKRAISELTEDVRMTQRQIRETSITVASNALRIAENTADVREWQFENKRILAFLEEQTKYYRAMQQQNNQNQQP